MERGDIDTALAETDVKKMPLTGSSPTGRKYLKTPVTGLGRTKLSCPKSGSYF